MNLAGPDSARLRLAIYKPDNQTQPYFIIGNYVNSNELDKLNASAYRSSLAAEHRIRLEE
jgi:hypothetical protein